MFFSKKIFVFLTILLNTIYLVACTQKTERVEIVDYRLFSEKIFQHINYNYVEKLNKEKSVISNVFINKEDMSMNVFNNEIEKRIKVQGWIEKTPDFEDQKLFCNGSKNRMSIVYPKKEIYRNEEGDVMNISSENLNKWVISFMYNYDGVRKCI